jgi:glycosyltransferase involved in cell wall biosynthesis
MKKILIASHSMEIGGAERSLLGLLNVIDHSQYSVDLFLYRHTGEFMSMIPEQVNLLPVNDRYASLAVPIVNLIKKKQLAMVAGRLFGKALAHRYQNGNYLKTSIVGLEYSHKYTKVFLPHINPQTCYDLAISFMTPHYIVAEKVKAKKKIAWIHADYSAYTINTESEKKMWDNYDYITSVSESCSETFCAVFPELKPKIIVIENILSPNYVRQQSEQFKVDGEIVPKTNTVKLLSVGRFNFEKNFESIPAICSIIVAAGYNINWYIIGYGSGELLLEAKIKEFGMQDHVKILGKKINPYPYFKACDIYIQPSRSEGKAVTVREAQILSKPVVITNFPTANSQLLNGVDGIIVSLDNRGCAEGIIKLINDQNMQMELIENCSNTDYGNEDEVKKLHRLIN